MALTLALGTSRLEAISAITTSVHYECRIRKRELPSQQSFLDFRLTLLILGFHLLFLEVMHKKWLLLYPFSLVLRKSEVIAV